MRGAGVLGGADPLHNTNSLLVMQHSLGASCLHSHMSMSGQKHDFNAEQLGEVTKYKYSVVVLKSFFHACHNVLVTFSLFVFCDGPKNKFEPLPCCARPSTIYRQILPILEFVFLCWACSCMRRMKTVTRGYAELTHH